MFYSKNYTDFSHEKSRHIEDLKNVERKINVLVNAPHIYKLKMKEWEQITAMFRSKKSVQKKIKKSPLSCSYLYIT